MVDELLIRGEKVGVLSFACTPFSAKHLLQALPGSVRSVAVLDITDNWCPGRTVIWMMTALAEAFNNGERNPAPLNWRDGFLSESAGLCTGGICRADAAKPKARFTVGIGR